MASSIILVERCCIRSGVDRRSVNILQAENLSMRGTSLVANSLLLSCLCHLSRVIAVPDKWLNQVRQHVHCFVASFWPTPSRNTICQRRNRGGLNVVNAHHQEQALQLICLQHKACQAPANDFCTPIARDLIQYHSGTVG